MSLSDKIHEILKKKPILGTAEILTELKNLGIDKSLRTIERHMSKLYKEKKIYVAVYSHEKRRPLYAVTDEKPEAFQSLIDDPRIDWSKIPYEERWRICLMHQLYREGKPTLEAYESNLLEYFPEYKEPQHDSLKPFKEKFKSLVSSKKK